MRSFGTFWVFRAPDSRKPHSKHYLFFKMAFENTSMYPPVTMERNFKTGHDGEDAAEILANLPKFMSNLPATTPNKGLGFVDNLSLRSSSSRPSSSLSQRKKPMKFFTASIRTETPSSPNSSPAVKGSRSSKVINKNNTTEN